VEDDVDERKDDMHDDTIRPSVSALGRRELMKLGAGVVTTALTPQRARAQAVAPGSKTQPREPRPHTGPGYRNDYNRASNNGPMDDTTRKIVGWVHSYSEANLTAPLIHDATRTMVDSVAAMITGFEQDSVRIAARMARQAQPGDLKSTVLGYGVTTTPELATFANGVMVRMTDFNDSGPGGHNSILIPGVLAIGEALHSTGAQVLTAVIVGYELAAVPAGGESAYTAMAVGKLMGLNEDQLANALTLALTPHVALNKGTGAMSMWKGARSAEGAKCGVWGALLAREGMTGPPQPFEGRGGLWDEFGRGREFTLPDSADGRMVVQRMGFKYIAPSDGITQGILDLIPELRAWTRAEDIASIQYDMNYSDWLECADAPKWDPRNHETADHSVPYTLARALIDGYIYLDSFTPAKYPNSDPVVRALIAKITCAPVEGWSAHGAARITIRKNSGEERSWDTLGGMKKQQGLSSSAGGANTGGHRHPDRGEHNTPMTDTDITDKFNRACAYMHVTDAQRDRARTTWWNISKLKDIGEAMSTLATFGNPLPL
jgi:2-methylcitrate dehydratase